MMSISSTCVEQATRRMDRREHWVKSMILVGGDGAEQWDHLMQSLSVAACGMTTVLNKAPEEGQPRVKLTL